MQKMISKVRHQNERKQRSPNKKIKDLTGIFGFRDGSCCCSKQRRFVPLQRLVVGIYKEKSFDGAIQGAFMNGDAD
jgi:hypothetical protein